MLLAVASRGKALDMGFDRLRNLGDLRVDDLLSIGGRATFPLVIFGRVDPRLGEEFAHQLAIGALERANENAFLGPALPDCFLPRRMRLDVMPGSWCRSSGLGFAVCQCRSPLLAGVVARAIRHC